MTKNNHFLLQLLRIAPFVYTENYKIFHYRLLSAKYIDKILWKLKKTQFWAHFGPFLFILG